MDTASSMQLPSPGLLSLVLPEAEDLEFGAVDPVRFQDQLKGLNLILRQDQRFMNEHILQRIGACPERLRGASQCYLHVCCRWKDRQPVDPMVREERVGSDRLVG